MGEAEKEKKKIRKMGRDVEVFTTREAFLMVGVKKSPKIWQHTAYVTKIDSNILRLRDVLQSIKAD